MNGSVCGATLRCVHLEFCGGASCWSVGLGEGTRGEGRGDCCLTTPAPLGLGRLTAQSVGVAVHPREGSTAEHTFSPQWVLSSRRDQG